MKPTLRTPAAFFLTLALLALSCRETPVNITVPPPEETPVQGTILGRLTDALSGAPMRNLTLTCSRVGSPDVLIETKATDSTGFYSFADLPAGSYRLAVQVPTGYAQVTIPAITFNSKSGTTGFRSDISLCPVVGTVTGSVFGANLPMSSGTNPTYTTQSGIRVQIDFSRYSPYVVPSSYSDTTDATGKFTLRNLPAGLLGRVTVLPWTDNAGASYSGIYNYSYSSYPYLPDVMPQSVPISLGNVICLQSNSAPIVLSCNVALTDTFPTRGTPIVAVFSKPMTSATIMVYGSNSPVYTNTVFNTVFNSERTNATVTPLAPLLRGSNYSVEITGTASDNSVLARTRFDFKTQPSLNVVSTSLLSGGTSVTNLDTAGTFIFTFNYPPNPATLVIGTNLYLGSSSAGVTLGTPSLSGNTLTVPYSGLQRSSSDYLYLSSVGSTLQDDRPINSSYFFRTRP